MNKVPDNIDHLVYTTSNLEVGMDEIEELLGVRPVLGGQHPDYGTHNAQLSIGESTYLEIIAPDPDLPPPERGRLFQETNNQKSRLTTWVLRTPNIEELHTKAKKNGLTLGPVEAGKRIKPDGSIISWKLTDPYVLPLNGAVPFLISWGNTTHPASAVPKAGELVSFLIEHPNPMLIMENLRLLGVDIEVNKGDSIKLIATIKTKNGIVTLE